MISKIFRSVFFTTILVLILGLVSSLVITSYQLIKSDSDGLVDYTVRLAEYINHDPSIDLTLLSISDYRVDLIDTKGRVYFDSKFPAENLDNHSNREEFREALENGQSKVSRLSSTLDKRTVYYAVRLDNGNVLRCAYTTDNLFSKTISMGLQLLIIFILAAFMSVYLAHRLSSKIVMPINTIDLNNPRDNEVYDELKPLLERIDSHQHRIKKLLRKVTAAHTQIKVMTSYMSEGIIFLNKKGESILINQSAQAIFNIDSTEPYIGKSILSLSRLPVFCSLFEKRNEIDSLKQDIEINSKYYRLIFNKIVDNSKLVGFVLLLVDITQAKQMQQQRQEFASNVSHELKTPLQSIIGRAELIENGIVRPNDLSAFGQKIKNEGQALLNMINDIMFLSKVESGVKSQTELLNLLTLSESIIDSLKDKALKKGVELRYDCQSVQIVFVRRYMSEILYNLIDNAIKYNKENGTVFLRIYMRENDLFIEVQDSGIGIPRDDIPRIFERFFCVDRSHSNKDSTGLGLTIVKHIVEECSGNIDVESVLGEGTKFTITFRCQIQNDDTFVLDSVQV
ncbi:MAG: sensor histidine kinase [Succinivibrio sp.]